MKKLITLFFVLAFLFSFSQQASAEPKGTMIVGMEAETYSMDPLYAWMTYGHVISCQIYDSLIDFAPDGKVRPRLAVSWQLLDDKTWRFNLRKGVKFHNGDPFTAADVKFTLERLLDPKNKARDRAHVASIEKLIIINDHTIDVKTKAPEPLLLNRLASYVHVVSKKFADEKGPETMRRHAMGTGPFRFVSWKRKDRLTLEANPGWYIAAPKVKTLIFRPIPETAARIAELQAGGVHIATYVPPFMVNQLKQGKDTDAQTVLSMRALFMVMNTLDVPELKDRRVRRALNYAVDKQAIINGLLNGQGVPLGTPAPMHVPGMDRSIKPYPHDPQKAKALLKEAGYPNGFPLNLYSPSGRYPMDKEVVQAVADQLSKFGIKPKVHVIETGTYFKRFMQHALKGICLVGDGYRMQSTERMFAWIDPKTPACYYHNNTLKEMAYKARAIMDREERHALSRKIQNMIHDEAIHLFLYNQVNSTGVSKKVKGFKPRPDGYIDLWNVSITQ